MFKSGLLLYLSVAVCFYSCHTENNKYNYAIKDFRKPLQPLLTEMVSKGIVMNDNSALRNMATDQELMQLGQSEHPILRSSAFREMLQRSSFNHFDMIMDHLSDTAIVFVDRGEFGISDRAVSDDILQEATWKSRTDKDKTIEEVLTKHSYLKSACYILSEIDPQEKYYFIIKNLATRPRRLSEDGYELAFGDIEYALYGLAKFKRKADIDVINIRIREHIGELSFVSFKLLAEYPDTAYFNIFLAYHRRQFYKSTGHSRNGFSGYVVDRADPEDFIHALVMQQSVGSAQLLDTMLKILPRQSCFPNKNFIVEEMIREIWKHRCAAYERLCEKIKAKVEEIKKGEISVPVDSLNIARADTVKMPIRW